MDNLFKGIEPKLALVGAGPGDPDLITIKGIRAIADADVILYDALIDTSLLKYARKSCLKIFVGKRCGQHAYPQDEINKMIVSYALTRGHVVRLKGGDPFVFGRGHEELEYAENHNIKVEIVPGITSAVSVPELQHIPLTKRGVNESFWVIAGTTTKGELSKDLYKAAETNATIIILMGMKKLKEISEIFLTAGKADIPAAIIQNGSLPDEAIAVSSVKNLTKIASENKLSAPAVIIIGEVAALHHSYGKMVKNRSIKKVAV